MIFRSLLLWLLIVSQAIFVFFNFQKIRAEWKFSHNELDEAIQITPFNFRFRMLKGTILLSQDKPKEAAEEFNATLYLFPFYFDAASNLAVAYARMGKIEQAQRIWRAVLESWPAHIESRENLAILNQAQQ